jgi:predicted naringenin-chalcone synthase
MSQMYELDSTEHRKLNFLYKHSGIKTRYSVVPDYSLPKAEWTFLPQNHEEDFPLLEQRMDIFSREALALSIKAINNCINGFIQPASITHLITVSCTGMSAPGLDLQITEAMELSPNIFRTSINFMGCYAAIHALKLAKMICDTTPNANVIIVDTELCTLHFQKKYTPDNAASSMLFADGCAAVLVSNFITYDNSISLKGFFSQVAFKGKNDMSWELSSQGFQMRLSGYIPQLIEEDIESLVNASLQQYQIEKNAITHWCIHPGGKKILQVIEQKLALQPTDLDCSRKVLAQYGNMSSPTILFVLKDMMEDMADNSTIFGVAFGPGLTMETFHAAKS